MQLMKMKRVENVIIVHKSFCTAVMDFTDVLLIKKIIYRTRAIITRGLYTFYPLFEVHLCTVTFGLMYG